MRALLAAGAALIGGSAGAAVGLAETQAYAISAALLVAAGALVAARAWTRHLLPLALGVLAWDLHDISLLVVEDALQWVDLAFPLEGLLPHAARSLRGQPLWMAGVAIGAALAWPGLGRLFGLAALGSGLRYASLALAQRGLLRGEVEAAALFAHLGLYVGPAVALIGLAGICRAFVPGLTGILIMTLLIGVGMGIGNTLMVVAVKERFADHPLMVTSVYAMGFQISSGVSAALAVPIALWLGGWQSTMLVYSAFTLVVLVAWLALTRGVSHNREIVSFPRLPLHRGVVWLLAVQFGLMGTLYYGINTWVPAAYVEHGSSLEYAGWLGALYNLGMIPGPLLALAASRRFSRRTLLQVTGLMIGAVAVLLIVAPEQAEIWMLVGGLANGAMFTLAMSLPLEVADSALDVGAAAAMMLFFASSGCTAR